MKTVSVGKQSGPPWRVHCPACDCAHLFTEGWAFNMNYSLPTFLPTMFIKTVDSSGNENICHSKVRNGMITYLSECTHRYRGRTIPLPEIIQLG